MPSGWTNSGIDWTDETTMRNSRTEDIVRELYLAVNERDYWIRSMSNGTSTLDRAGRLRTENQLQYIYTKLRSWFKPMSEYIGSFTFDESESVFIDDTITPQNPTGDIEELFYFGYDSYNYELNGNLETLISRDLSFLRDYLSSSYRLRLEDFKTIYEILNTKLKNRIFKYSFDGTDYNVTRFSNTGTQVLARRFMFGNDSDTAPNADSTQATNDFYTHSNFNDSIFVNSPYQGNLELSSNFSSDVYQTSQKTDLIKFSPTGYNTNVFDVDDFDFNSYNYGLVDNDDFGVMPTAAYTLGHETISNKTVNIPITGGFPNGGIYALLHREAISSGIPTYQRPGSRSEQVSEALPFIGLDLEGFLNYYTEPTP